MLSRAEDPSRPGSAGRRPQPIHLLPKTSSQTITNHGGRPKFPTTDRLIQNFESRLNGGDQDSGATASDMALSLVRTTTTVELTRLNAWFRPWASVERQTDPQRYDRDDSNQQAAHLHPRTSAGRRIGV